jgi:GTP cyclohydrolase II
MTIMKNLSLMKMKRLMNNIKYKILEKSGFKYVESKEMGRAL